MPMLKVSVVSPTGLEEVWRLVLQGAAQVHHAFEEQQQTHRGALAASAERASRVGGRGRRDQPFLHLGQGQRLVGGSLPRRQAGRRARLLLLLAACSSQGRLAGRSARCSSAVGKQGQACAGCVLLCLMLRVRLAKGEAPSPGLGERVLGFAAWITPGELCFKCVSEKLFINLALKSLKIYRLQRSHPCSLRQTLIEVDPCITCGFLARCRIRSHSRGCLVGLFFSPLFHLSSPSLLIRPLQCRAWSELGGNSTALRS